MLRGHRLERPAPRRERLGAVGRGAVGEPDQGAQPRPEPVALDRGLGEDVDRPGELDLHLVRRVRVQDAGLGLHDVGQRRERHALPVRAAAADAPADDVALPVQGLGELLDQPGLADAGLAAHRHELDGGAAHRAAVRGAQQRGLVLAPDERRPRALADEPSGHRDRPPGLERSAPAGYRDRRELLEREQLARRPVGRLAERDPPDRRRRLEQARAGGDLAGHPLAGLRPRSDGDDGVAGVDPDPGREAQTGMLLVELLDRVQQTERCPDGALGIVFVAHRRSEHADHGVPDELVEGAAVVLQLARDPGVERAQRLLDVLRIRAVRARGEPDEVAEQDGHRLALDAEAFVLAQGGSTGDTETSPIRVRSTARGARTHAAPSVRTVRPPREPRRSGPPAQTFGRPGRNIWGRRSPT